MLELQLHDIEVRLTVAKLADDGLASDAGLVAATGPGQPVASGRSSLVRRASLSGSFCSGLARRAARAGQRAGAYPRREPLPARGAGRPARALAGAYPRNK
jgi:hypothetical protein